jgi:hypothetical protein
MCERPFRCQQGTSGSPVLQHLGNPFARLAVTVWVDCGRHPAMSMLDAQQFPDVFDNRFSCRADDASEPGLCGLRALGGLAQNEHGNTERRRFFLDAARVRKDQVGATHKREKRDVAQGRQQLDARVVTEQAGNRFSDIGVGMDWESHDYIGVPLGDDADRTANFLEVAAPTFAPVRGHKEQAASFKIGLVEAASVQHRRVRGAEQVQRIDDGISGNRAPLGIEAVPQQVRLRLRSGRQQDRRNRVDHLPVGLFRKRIGKVAAAQPRLDMRDGDPRIEARERRGHGRRRVALDDNDVGTAVYKVPTEFAHYVAGRIRKRAADRSNGKRLISGQPKGGQRGTADFTVLSGSDETDTKLVRPLSQGLDHRSEFDRFRSGADDDVTTQRGRLVHRNMVHRLAADLDSAVRSNTRAFGYTPSSDGWAQAHPISNLGMISGDGPSLPGNHPYSITFG